MAFNSLLGTLDRHCRHDRSAHLLTLHQIRLGILVHDAGHATITAVKAAIV